MLGLAQCLVDPGQQGGLGERLLEDVHLRAVRAMAGQNRLGVARHVQHGQAGAVLLHALGNIGAEHLRHDHVGQQQVDAVARVGGVLDRSGAGAGLVDAVAVTGQDPVRELAEAFLVLDQSAASRIWLMSESTGFSRVSCCASEVSWSPVRLV